MKKKEDKEEITMQIIVIDELNQGKNILRELQDMFERKRGTWIDILEISQ